MWVSTANGTLAVGHRLWGPPLLGQRCGPFAVGRPLWVPLWATSCGLSVVGHSLWDTNCGLRGAPPPQWLVLRVASTLWSHMVGNGHYLVSGLECY